MRLIGLVLWLLLIGQEFIQPLIKPNGGGGGGGYLHYQSIAFDHTKAGSSDSSNFVALVSGTYTNLKAISSGGSYVQSSSGYDIGFFSDTGCSVKLNWETEVYTAASGLVIYWVQLPTLSHTSDTTIYLCFDNASVTTDQSNKTATYDSTFGLVAHYPNGSSLALNDSTSNANTGSGVNTPTATTGKIDGAAALVAASSQYINQGTGASMAPTTGVTFSAWISATTNGGFATVMDRNDGTDGSAVDVTLYNPGPPMNLYLTVCTASGCRTVIGTIGIPLNTPTLVAMTYSAAAGVASYVNGAPDTTGATEGALVTNTAQLVVGAGLGGVSRYFDGWIDEVRVANVARSADYMLADYNSQASPSTFYTVGSLH